MLINFPFNSLSDFEIQDLFVEHELRFDNFSNIYFKHVSDVDSHEQLYDPDFQLSSKKLESNYYDIANFPTKYQFRVLHANIRSLKKNYESFLAEFSSMSSDLILLNETWLENTSEYLYNIPGYQPFHQSRDGRGGGV